MAFDFRPLVVWLILLTAAFVGGAYLGDQSGADRVQAAWDKSELSRSKDLLKEIDRAQERQQRADENHNKVVKELTDANHNLRADYRRLAERLRERPVSADSGGQPEEAPAAPAGTWCTGAQLYGDHAAAFAGEAARAQYLQSALKACYALHDDPV